MAEELRSTSPAPEISRNSASEGQAHAGNMHDISESCRDPSNSHTAPSSHLDSGDNRKLDLASNQSKPLGSQPETAREGQTALVSWEGAILTIFLPYCDLLRILYIYSCVPLHFRTSILIRISLLLPPLFNEQSSTLSPQPPSERPILHSKTRGSACGIKPSALNPQFPKPKPKTVDSSWPLWQFSALIFSGAAVRNVTAAVVAKSGDRSSVIMLLAATLASAVMVWKPDTRWAVIIGIFFSNVSQCTQAYRGLLHKTFGASSETHATALRVFNVSDVLGYSTASFVGGLLYDIGGFAACSWGQLTLCIIEGLLATALLLKGEGNSTASEDEPTDDIEAGDEKQKCPPTLMAGGTWASASLVVVSVGVSIFLYACEWNTFALYFREVYDWGSTWTGFAQMAGDLLAAFLLLISAMLRLPLPWILEPPHGLFVVFLMFAVFFVMMAQNTFEVAVAGQVAMGSAYVLSVELLSSMLLVYGRGQAALYRSLLFKREICFNVGIALAAVSVLVYDIDKTLPFYLGGAIALSWASLCLGFFCFRFGREFAWSGTFADTESTLLERHLAKATSVPPSGIADGKLTFLSRDEYRA